MKSNFYKCKIHLNFVIIIFHYPSSYSLYYVFSPPVMFSWSLVDRLLDKSTVEFSGGEPE